MPATAHSPAAMPAFDELLDEHQRHGSLEGAGSIDRDAVLGWALDRLSAADRRVADLEQRLRYLESLSVTDELTHLLNRRGFLAELTRALSWARRGGSGGAVLVCDLDGFKAINDRHGHAAGNLVLRELGARLARQLRRCDAVSRLGGDEFAFLLVGATRTGATNKAVGLAKVIDELGVVIDGHPVRLSASFGLALYKGGEDEETVLHTADLAMYEMKRRHHEALFAVG